MEPFRLASHERQASLIAIELYLKKRNRRRGLRYRLMAVRRLTSAPARSTTCKRKAPGLPPVNERNVASNFNVGEDTAGLHTGCWLAVWWIVMKPPHAACVSACKRYSAYLVQRSFCLSPAFQQACEAAHCHVLTLS